MARGASPKHDPLGTGRAGLELSASLTRSMLVGVRELSVAPERVSRSLRIAACVVAPLVVGLAFGHITWGLAATFGAFTGFHGHIEPYPQRARVLAGMAVGYLAAVMVGTLVAGTPVAVVLGVGAFAAITAFVCQAVQLPAPREYMLVLICLLNSSLPAPLASTAGVAALPPGGGGWGWVRGWCGGGGAP